MRISPQNLGEEAVQLLGHTNLRHLHILQNRYTPNDSTIQPVSPRTWRDCKKHNPRLCVHLEVEGPREKEILWQRAAPVKSVLYNSTHVKVLFSLQYKINFV